MSFKYLSIFPSRRRKGKALSCQKVRRDLAWLTIGFKTRPASWWLSLLSGWVTKHDAQRCSKLVLLGLGCIYSSPRAPLGPRREPAQRWHPEDGAWELHSDIWTALLTVLLCSVHVSCLPVKPLFCFPREKILVKGRNWTLSRLVTSDVARFWYWVDL